MPSQYQYATAKKADPTTDTEFKAKIHDELLDFIKSLGFDVDNMTYNESSDLIKQLCEANMHEYVANLAVRLTNTAVVLNDKIKAFDTALVNMQDLFKMIQDMSSTLLDQGAKIQSLEHKTRHPKDMDAVVDLVNRLVALGTCTFTTRQDMNRQVQSKISQPSMIGLRRVIEAYAPGTP